MADIIGYTPKDGDIPAWTVAIPQLKFRFGKKGQKDAQTFMRYIKEFDGFLGLHPVPGKGILLLFDSENHAKGGRNLLKCINMPVGTNIGKCYIPKEI